MLVFLGRARELHFQVIFGRSLASPESRVPWPLPADTRDSLVSASTYLLKRPGTKVTDLKKGVPINVDTPLRSNRFPLYQNSKFEPLRTRQLLGRVLLGCLGRKTIRPCSLYRPGRTSMFHVLWNSTM